MIYQKRRDLIKTFAKSLVGSSVFSSGLVSLLANASASNDYKALVCINLDGGNDGYNTLVPMGNSYATYEAIRRDVALPREQLRSLSAFSSNIEACGLHPALEQTSRLFNEGRISWVGNIGNLVEPVTKASYQSKGVALPPHLFSHNDQTIFSHTLGLQGESNHGWAGRIADAMADININQQLSMNISLSGENHLQRTPSKLPYVVKNSGVNVVDALSEENPSNFSASRAALYRDFISRERPHVLQQHFANVQLDAWVMAQYMSDVLSSQPALSLPIFSQSSQRGLVESLGMILRLIAANDAFQVRRQIFYVDLPGFDTHRNQLADQASMLNELDAGLHYFNQGLSALGYQDKVTTFTLSEFGRTLSRNGNNGTDHGWTNNHLVMGAAVNGRRIFGNLPDLYPDSDYDIGEGRIIPQFSFDQYAATLCKWFGLSEEDINQIFPNLQNFGQDNLGFMR